MSGGGGFSPDAVSTSAGAGEAEGAEATGAEAEADMGDAEAEADKAEADNSDGRVCPSARPSPARGWASRPHAAAQAARRQAHATQRTSLTAGRKPTIRLVPLPSSASGAL
jgi:hypothetical protein